MADVAELEKSAQASEKKAEKIEKDTAAAVEKNDKKKTPDPKVDEKASEDYPKAAKVRAAQAKDLEKCGAEEAKSPNVAMKKSAVSRYEQAAEAAKKAAEDYTKAADLDLAKFRRTQGQHELDEYIEFTELAAKNYDLAARELEAAANVVLSILNPNRADAKKKYTDAAALHGQSASSYGDASKEATANNLPATAAADDTNKQIQDQSSANDKNIAKQL